MRREATAEASLARRRDLRKLGTAIAAMIRITATTRSSSIRENPLWLRMNTPEPNASVGGRGPGGVRPTRNPSSGDASSHAGDSSPNRWAEKAILSWYRREHEAAGRRSRRAAETERILEKSKGRKGRRFTLKQGMPFRLVKSVHRALRDRYSLVLRRSQRVTILVGSTASLSI